MRENFKSSQLLFKTFAQIIDIIACNKIFKQQMFIVDIDLKKIHA